MALIIETGQQEANANSFVTDLEYTTYATAKGLTVAALAADRAIDLISAIDYLTSVEPSLQGYRASSTQVLFYPRIGVELHGFALATDKIPNELKNAQMEAAVVNAKHDRKVLEDELKKLNDGSKKDQEQMDKMLAKQDEVIDASKKEADAFKGELEVAKETRNTMLEMRNLTEEQVQTEKEQIAEIEDMKNAQKAYKESYEKTEGAKATDSKIFNKTKR